MRWGQTKMYACCAGDNVRSRPKQASKRSFFWLLRSAPDQAGLARVEGFHGSNLFLFARRYERKFANCVTWGRKSAKGRNVTPPENLFCPESVALARQVASKRNGTRPCTEPRPHRATPTDRPTRRPGDGGQTEARPTDRLTDRPADGRPASPGAYEQIRDHRDMATAVVPAPSADGMLAGHGVERLRGVFNTEARVAVVGSSGNLLFRGHGAEIDAHDIVIRMKYALQAIELASVRARRDRGDRGDRGDRLALATAYRTRFESRTEQRRRHCNVRTRRG
jgi:hypothetical protein